VSAPDGHAGAPTAATRRDRDARPAPTVRRGVAPDRRGALRRDLAVRRLGRVLGWTVPLVALAFLWLPIAVLVGFSFNDAASVSTWRGSACAGTRTCSPASRAARRASRPTCCCARS
jgi:hypothetical protein